MHGTLLEGTTGAQGAVRHIDLHTSRGHRNASVAQQGGELAGRQTDGSRAADQGRRRGLPSHPAAEGSSLAAGNQTAGSKNSVETTRTKTWNIQ